MVQDLEKNFEENVNKARDGQNESVIKKQQKAESLWEGYAEKSFEVDPNYKTWGYVRGICVYLGFEAMSKYIWEYLVHAMDDPAKILEEMRYSSNMNLKPEVVAIFKENLRHSLEDSAPVVAQAACAAVFYLFLNFFIFKYAQRVLKHHGQVLTGGINYYSLLAIFMPFYFILQSIRLPYTYGCIAFSAWDIREQISFELMKLT